MDYPGYTVETTHPTDVEAEGYCAACAEAVPSTIAVAVATESPAHGYQFEQPAGTVHLIVVRAV